MCMTCVDLFSKFFESFHTNIYFTNANKTVNLELVNKYL